MAHAVAPPKSMTFGEAGSAAAFVGLALLSIVVAAKAYTPEYAFHAYLFAAGSVAAVSIFNRYAGRPAGPAPLTVDGRPNYNMGPVKFATLAAMVWGIWAEALAGAALFAGTAVAAAFAHVAALAATLALPPIRPQPAPAPVERRSWWAVLAATAIAALAWFAMAALMGATPLAMAGCGLSGALVTGAVAWHVVAMYGPALILPPLPGEMRAGLLVGLFAACLAAAAALFGLAAGPELFTASAGLVGVGWCPVSLGTTLWLHRDGPPSRLVLAGHDAVLLTSALLGAFAAAPAGP